MYYVCITWQQLILVDIQYHQQLSLCGFFILSLIETECLRQTAGEQQTSSLTDNI